MLGVGFGTEFNADRQFRTITTKIGHLHDALATTDDTATELILLRQCADVCKIVHLLRAAGPQIEIGSLK